MRVESSLGFSYYKMMRGGRPADEWRVRRASGGGEAALTSRTDRSASLQLSLKRVRSLFSELWRGSTLLATGWNSSPKAPDASMSVSEKREFTCSWAKSKNRVLRNQDLQNIKEEMTDLCGTLNWCEGRASFLPKQASFSLENAAFIILFQTPPAALSLHSGKQATDSRKSLGRRDLLRSNLLLLILKADFPEKPTTSRISEDRHPTSWIHGIVLVWVFIILQIPH